MKTPSEDYKPTNKIADNAAKGLELHHQFHRGGTEIGVARAKQLKIQEALGLPIIKRIFSYFRRHEVDKKGKNFGNDQAPSRGYIAWLLWGGDEGYKWVKKILHKQ